MENTPIIFHEDDPYLRLIQHQQHVIRTIIEDNQKNKSEENIEKIKEFNSCIKNSKKQFYCIDTKILFFNMTSQTTLGNEPNIISMIFDYACIPEIMYAFMKLPYQGGNPFVQKMVIPDRKCTITFFNKQGFLSYPAQLTIKVKVIDNNTIKNPIRDAKDVIKQLINNRLLPQTVDDAKNTPEPEYTVIAHSKDNDTKYSIHYKIDHIFTKTIIPFCENSLQNTNNLNLRIDHNHPISIDVFNPSSNIHSTKKLHLTHSNGEAKVIACFLWQYTEQHKNHGYYLFVKKEFRDKSETVASEIIEIYHLPSLDTSPIFLDSLPFQKKLYIQNGVILGNGGIFTRGIFTSGNEKRYLLEYLLPYRTLFAANETPGAKKQKAKEKKQSDRKTGEEKFYIEGIYICKKALVSFCIFLLLSFSSNKIKKVYSDNTLFNSNVKLVIEWLYVISVCSFGIHAIYCAWWELPNKRAEYKRKYNSI